MAIADTTRSTVARERWIAHKLPRERSVMSIYQPTFDSLARPATVSTSEAPHQRSSPLPQPAAHAQRANLAAPSAGATAQSTNALPRLPSIRRRFAKQVQSVRQIKDLAARLALLLHARECCRGDAGCTVSNCSIARGVLDHCQECFLADGACHTSCAQAKRLLRHFRICRARNFTIECSICSTLRTECTWALRHVKSLTPLFLSTPQSQSTRTSVPVMAPLQTANDSSASHVVGGPVSLRRVVSDDPSLQRHRQPLSLHPTKRQRFE